MPKQLRSWVGVRSATTGHPGHSKGSADKCGSGFIRVKEEPTLSAGSTQNQYEPPPASEEPAGGRLEEAITFQHFHAFVSWFPVYTGVSRGDGFLPVERQ